MVVENRWVTKMIDMGIEQINAEVAASTAVTLEEAMDMAMIKTVRMYSWVPFFLYICDVKMDSSNHASPQRPYVSRR